MPLVPGTYAQLKYVEPPPPVRLPFGLFSVATILDVNDAHENSGVEWQPSECGPATIYNNPACGNIAPEKTYDATVSLSQAFPFTVYGSFKCSPIGHWDDGYDRAREHLRTGAERAVELAAYSGTHQAQVLTATTDDLTPTPGTAVTIERAVAILEQYIGANNNGLGVLWMTRREATLAAHRRVLVDPRSDVQQLRTYLNTPVIAASGFDGKATVDGQTPGAESAWIFATGLPIIRRGAVFMTSPDRENALNTTNNDFEVLAEQTYSIGWDCLTAAVLVDQTP